MYVLYAEIKCGKGVGRGMMERVQNLMKRPVLKRLESGQKME